MAQINKNLLDELIAFNEGNHYHAYKVLGCQPSHEDGEEGYRFTVWAPRAKQVFLTGDFNNWNPELMEPVFESGCWSLFKKDAHDLQNYKYQIRTHEDDYILKIDPFANRFEMPPQEASIVSAIQPFDWQDGAWMDQRSKTDHAKNPMNIYEVHMGSWKKHYDGRNYSFDDLIEHLIPYVKDMGYTHIEFMPLMEHPLDASWGYQITGYFAVAARYGDASGLKRFVNAAHQADLSIILDWVPGHYCQNNDAIAYFDGTATFEYENPIKARNKRWGTFNFDLGKTQVQSFLYSSLMYWLEEFHIDGIRVDAVSNMLYLDYDLEPHVLNEDGSNNNREGEAFLKKMTDLAHQLPGVFIIAEESTNWKGVTSPTQKGGLGFDYKWNMGWMNDTLRFFEMDPINRKHHFNLVTFVFVYMYNEKYILPLSHDEVVHGKKSLLGKMPGDRYNQFAQLRLLYALMMGVSGKTINFMGNELGQFIEWRFYSELEWKDLQNEFNSEYQHYIKTMNYILLENKPLYEKDHIKGGSKLMYVHEEESTLILLRKGYHDSIYILLNFVPVERDLFTFDVEEDGVYECILNSEMKEFGGTWVNNLESINSVKKTLTVTLPAYGVLMIRRRGL